MKLPLYPMEDPSKKDRVNQSGIDSDMDVNSERALVFAVSVLVVFLVFIGCVLVFL